MSDRKLPTLGSVRQELAELGAELSASATLLPYERPTGPSPVVIVDRVRDLTEAPTYCIHGFTNCVKCDEWCYLGSETKRVVLSREAVPLCIVCGQESIPEGSELMKRVFDHPADRGEAFFKSRE